MLPRMIDLLANSTSSDVKFEIAWGLTNMACGEYQHAQAVVHSGAVPVLVGLMLHSVDKVRCCQSRTTGPAVGLSLVYPFVCIFSMDASLLSVCCPTFFQRSSPVDNRQPLWPLRPVSRRHVSSRCN